MSLILQKNKKEPIIIYCHFQNYGDNEFQLTISCTCKIKVNWKNEQPVVDNYMIIIKWSYFETPKTQLLLSINLLLCTSQHVLVLVHFI